MDWNSETFTINVRMGNLIFPITVKRRDEEIYRKAERLINERYNYYATHYPNQSNDSYMAMAMLDIALTLKKNEDRNETAPIMNIVDSILKEVEEAIEDNEGEKNNM